MGTAGRGVFIINRRGSSSSRTSAELFDPLRCRRSGKPLGLEASARQPATQSIGWLLNGPESSKYSREHPDINSQHWWFISAPKMRQDVPENDPSHPRWLLDIKNWRVHPYKDIANDVENTGYGIVSYTWGMWADFDKPAEGLPENIQWNIPTVEGISLDHARKVLDNAMDIRFVWWDWMCVPQGKRNKKVTLDDDLEKVKGEEIAKQMAIYKGARKSTVWLHRTRWDEGPRLATYLNGDFKKHTSFEGTLTELHQCIKGIQEDEPWLTSGWTLQEGVLLESTHLLDLYGKGLFGDFFMTGEQASVTHLSLHASVLVTHVTTAFVRYSQGLRSSKDALQGTPEQEKQAIDYINASPENYKYAATFVTTLLRSGFVCYWRGRQTVLFLLVGSQGRRFMAPEDKCWALIGALELEGLNPWYSKNPKDSEGKEEDLRKIKKEFFIPMLKKYQWEALLVPEVQDEAYNRMTWPERVVHGGVLPLGLYWVEDINESLPLLEYDETNDQLIITTAEFVKPKSRIFSRHYRQKSLDEKEGFIEVDKISTENVFGHTYLPLRDIPAPYIPSPEPEGWNKIKHGVRCVDIQLAPGSENSGYFKGIVELWGEPDSFERFTLPKFHICGSRS